MCVRVRLSVRTFGKLLYAVGLVLPTFYRRLNEALSPVQQKKEPFVTAGKE